MYHNNADSSVELYEHDLSSLIRFIRSYRYRIQYDVSADTVACDIKGNETLMNILRFALGNFPLTMVTSPITHSHPRVLKVDQKKGGLNQRELL